MVVGELLQDLFALRSQGKQHFAAIFTAAISPDVAAGREPVHQFHRTVMSNLQPLCQLSNPRPDPASQPFQSQHQLMLARLQARRFRSLLTEVKKTANLIAQLRQGFEVRRSEGPFHIAEYTVLQNPAFYIVLRYTYTVRI